MQRPAGAVRRHSGHRWAHLGPDRRALASIALSRGTADAGSAGRPPPGPGLSAQREGGKSGRRKVPSGWAGRRDPGAGIPMGRRLCVPLPIVLCGTLSGCALLLAQAAVDASWGTDSEGERTPELGYMIEASPQYAPPGDRVDLQVSASWSCSNEPHTMPDTTATSSATLRSSTREPYVPGGTPHGGKSPRSARYRRFVRCLVGPPGFEPGTSRL